MSKGQQTRAAIVEQAMHSASRFGFEGLSIGALAEKTRLSKSGLFIHFGSKENLHIEILSAVARRFTDQVFRPAIQQPRGIPRLRAIFDHWLQWEDQFDGGCPFITASIEFDDRPGPVRDFLVQVQSQLRSALIKAARIALEEGHLRKELRPEQFAFEMQGILLSYHYSARLLRDPKARSQARGAFRNLLERATSRKGARLLG